MKRKYEEIFDMVSIVIILLMLILYLFRYVCNFPPLWSWNFAGWFFALIYYIGKIFVFEK